MENNLTVTLGGVERTLVIGKIKFLRHLGKLTEQTGFNFFDPTIRTNLSKAYQSVFFIIEAALRSNNIDATLDEVERWVDELDIDMVTEIQWYGFSAITGKSVDELKNAAAQAVTSNGVS